MRIFSVFLKWWPHHLLREGRFRPARVFAGLCGLGLGLGFFLTASAPNGFFCAVANAQRAAPSEPVIVQPGAPGMPSKRLPASTTAQLPSQSQADVEFMQGMIMHHAQAVEMTALIASHTQNKNLRSLVFFFKQKTAYEIKFMKRWL